MILTDEVRAELAALPRDDNGLRPQEPVEQDAHTAVVIACERLRRDGFVFRLPPIARRTR